VQVQKYEIIYPGNFLLLIVLKQTNSQHSLQYESSFISDESEDEVSDEDKPVIKGPLMRFSDSHLT
jgi:hypothetical protein